MSGSSSRRERVCDALLVLALALAGSSLGCASGARDVDGITPVPEEPIPGSTREDAGGMDGGDDSGMSDAGPMDAGVDSGPIDAGFDAGMGMGVTCTADLPNSCANAAMRTVTVAPNTSATVSGAVDAAGDDYFLVNFTGVTGPGTFFHPRIEFTSNPTNLYSFTLETTCGNAFTPCSAPRTAFEMLYPVKLDCEPYANCSDDVARATSLIVRVRRSNVPNNCFQYGIVVSNEP
jgi:hypothetical protein